MLEKKLLFQSVLNFNQRKELTEYYKTCGLHLQRTFMQMVNGTRLLCNYFILPFSIFAPLVVDELYHYSEATSQNVENETRVKLHLNDELHDFTNYSSKQQIVQYRSTLIWRLVLMQTLQQLFHTLNYRVNAKRVSFIVAFTYIKVLD